MSAPPTASATTLLEQGLFDFTLPPALEADTPAERRGTTRDGVRMMVSYRSDGRLEDTVFRQLPSYLVPGDLLVVNTSGTLPAALDARLADGTRVTVHLSTRLPGGLWTLELRELGEGKANVAFRGGRPGMELALPDEGRAILVVPASERSRIWVADVHLGVDAGAYLARNGRPIRYSHIGRDWPIEDYQTVYASEPGSTEMPSAGRPFTPELITRLVASGVAIAPLLLHTGVSSLEVGEPPYEEWYRVPADTARRVNQARDAGGRIVAVGTTVVRALETVASYDGQAHPSEGWTGKVVTPEEGVQLVDGLVTGWHEPRASHLAMIEAIAGRDLVERSYQAALQAGYLWHEFGDVHLVLP